MSLGGRLSGCRSMLIAAPASFCGRSQEYRLKASPSDQPKCWTPCSVGRQLAGKLVFNKTRTPVIIPENAVFVLALAERVAYPSVQWTAKRCPAISGLRKVRNYALTIEMMLCQVQAT